MASKLERAAGTRNRLKSLARILRLGGRSSAGSARAPARIGVLLQWGIGDATLTLPLLQAMGARYPGASLELIGKGFLPELFANEPGRRRFHLLEPPWTAFSGKYRVWDRRWRRYLISLWKIRREKFDLLVLPRPDPRDLVQAQVIGARATAGFGALGGEEWLTIAAPGSLEEVFTLPRGEIAARLAETIVGHAVSAIPRFEAAPVRRAPDIWLAEHGYRGGPVLAVCFGASHPLRRWDSAKVSEVLARVASRIGFLIVIADGPESASAIEPPQGVPSLVWRSNLTALKQALVDSDLLFCADSGPMHVAAALGVPVLSVFGPTSLRSFGPHGEGHAVVAIEPMDCRPCFDACIHPRARCMLDLGVDTVETALLAALSRIGSAPSGRDPAQGREP